MSNENEIESSPHYDDAYYEWQKDSGAFGGWANVDKYRNTVTPASNVLDFGCGGGFLLANLDCAGRFGVEPNPSARAVATDNGVTVFADVAEALKVLGPDSIDIIISDNALEHALEPWRELRALHGLLKASGKIHLVVPCESVGWKYRPNDINQHVYSWSPQSLGNLLRAAGYQVDYSRPYIHKWPPFGLARRIARFGRPFFNLTARVWGRVDRRWFQVEALGLKARAEGDQQQND